MYTEQLTEIGLYFERLNYFTRAFIPTGEKSGPIIDELIRLYPVDEVIASQKTVEQELAERVDEALSPDPDVEFLGLNWVPPWQKKGRGAGSGMEGSGQQYDDDYFRFEEEDVQRAWEEAERHAESHTKISLTELSLCGTST